MAEDQQIGAPAATAGRAWLARMPDQVAAQRALLEHLLDAAVLDTAGFTLPDGIEATTAGLRPAALLDAAMTMANLLEQVTRRARRSVPFDPPDGLRARTRSRLAQVGVR